MTEVSGLFGFEKRDFESLDLIPLAIRYRLDRCGLRLSLSAWRRFPAPERAALLRAASTTNDATWRDRLLTIVARSHTEAPVPIALWVNPSRIPEDVQRVCAEYACGMDEDTWHRLPEIQRYVLCKLAKSKWGDRFLPQALREIGIHALHP